MPQFCFPENDKNADFNYIDQLKVPSRKYITIIYALKSDRQNHILLNSSSVKTNTMVIPDMGS